jgi:hypothetical protein
MSALPVSSSDIFLTNFAGMFLAPLALLVSITIIVAVATRDRRGRR